MRAVTGNIAASMGLHAGWVWVITFLREGTQPNDEHPLRAFLVSQFDGVVGWLVLAWTIVIGVVIYQTLRAQAAGQRSVVRMNGAIRSSRATGSSSSRQCLLVRRGQAAGSPPVAHPTQPASSKFVGSML